MEIFNEALYDAIIENPTDPALESLLFTELFGHDISIEGTEIMKRPSTDLAKRSTTAVDGVPRKLIEKLVAVLDRISERASSILKKSLPAGNGDKLGKEIKMIDDHARHYSSGLKEAARKNDVNGAKRLCKETMTFLSQMARNCVPSVRAVNTQQASHLSGLLKKALAIGGVLVAGLLARKGIKAHNASKTLGGRIKKFAGKHKFGIGATGVGAGAAGTYAYSQS